MNTNTKNNYNPQGHFSIIARILLEISKGNYEQALYKLIELSKCDKRYMFEMCLNSMFIFPGTRKDMSVKTFEDLFQFFQENGGRSAVVEEMLKDCLDKEFEIYRTIKDEEEAFFEYGRKYDW
jgi:hypothetical protein